MKGFVMTSETSQSRFHVKWPNPTVGESRITFTLNAQGKVEEAKVQGRFPNCQCVQYAPIQRARHQCFGGDVWSNFFHRRQSACHSIRPEVEFLKCR